MKLMYKNTTLDFKKEITNSNFGLNESDRWCLINISIKSDDTNYEQQEEILTLKEIENTIDKIDSFINGNIKSLNIKYIKNFIKINLSNKADKKILELTLIEPKSTSNKKHKIYLEDNEIITFVKILKGE